MSKQDLKNLVSKLREEAVLLSDSDQAIKSRVEELANLLDKKCDGADSEDLVEKLEDSLTEFEVSHPRLTELFNQVLTTLSSLGI